MRKFSVLLIFFFLTANLVYSAAKFTDIENHWAKKYIESFSTDVIFENYSDNLFKPNQPLSRAEAVNAVMGILVSRSYEKMIGTNGGPIPDCFLNHPFSDINDSTAYDYYIKIAYCNKIVTGYKTGGQIYFYPNNLISRAEFLALTLKAFHYNLDYDIDNFNNLPFKDVENNSWYTPFIVVAYENGIIKGKTKNLFKPHDSITRAEAAKIVIETRKLNPTVKNPYPVNCEIDYTKWLEKYDSNFAIIEIPTEENKLIYRVDNTRNGMTMKSEYFISAFYECYDDDYDFLVFVSNLHDLEDAAPSYSSIKNLDEGIGRARDDSGYFLYGTEKLKGVVEDILLPYFAPYEEVNSALQRTVAHEIGHQWIFHFGENNGLNSGNGHYSWYLSIEDILGGVIWEETRPSVFNGIRESLPREITSRKFYPISLYLMGLMSKEEAWGPYMLLIPEKTIFGGLQAKAKYFTLDEIVEGQERIPGYPNTQKDFSVAFVFVTNDLNTVTKEQVDQLAKLVDTFPDFWAEATDHRSTMNTNIYLKKSNETKNL